MCLPLRQDACYCLWHFIDGIRGHIWDDLLILARTVVFGIAGVFLVFYGFRLILEQLGRWGSRHERLGMFTFRQLEEMFIRKSSVPAVSCILILAALCLFGAQNRDRQKLYGTERACRRLYI